MPSRSSPPVKLFWVQTARERERREKERGIVNPPGMGAGESRERQIRGEGRRRCRRGAGGVDYP